MDTDSVWRAIDAERTRLADLLDDLTPAEWETPSLCRAWRVRDVAAHLTLAQMSTGTALAALARSGGRMDAMIRDTALRRSRLPVEEFPARIRRMVGSRRTAPFVTELEPLIDALVHAQDIAHPLARALPAPAEPAAAAATRVWSMGFPFRARRRLAGFELVASDADWSAGRGERVEGPIGSILLLLTGRAAALPDLTGDGAAALRELRHLAEPPV